MRNCLALSLIAALLGSGCAKVPPDALEPFHYGSPRKAKLPDAYERSAADLAEFALAGRHKDLAGPMSQLIALEGERKQRGREPTGLLDNAAALVAATRGERSFLEFAEDYRALGLADPRLERPLDRYLDQQPLGRAEKRLAEHRRAMAAAIFNRISRPASNIALGYFTNPYDTGRAALSALLIARSLPKLSTRERQALHAYAEYLSKNPDAPETPWVATQLEHYGDALVRARQKTALDRVENSLEKGQTTAAQYHLRRAERIAELDDTGFYEEISQLVAQQETRLESALTVKPSRLDRTGEGTLLAALAGQHPSRIRSESRALSRSQADDESLFLQASELRERDAYEEHLGLLEELAERRDDRSNMARHARAVVSDPHQNPFAFYRSALQQEKRARRSWLLWGNRYKHARNRGLWRPAEWLVDIPTFAVSLVTLPQRAVQYHATRSRFQANVLRTGERYVSHYPAGVHAADVRSDLEDRYRGQGLWSRALAHHQALPEPDPERLSEYRQKLAEAMLQMAPSRRIDVRASIYRTIVTEYSDTPQAALAEKAFQKLVEDTTPQSIRISREFLLDNPELVDRGALGLVDELLDERRDNGELAEAGITLLGMNVVRVHLEDQEPVDRDIPPQNFARFISMLEEVRYHHLVTDRREVAEPDPQRDLFFERARLGLIDKADSRPAARSAFQVLGRREKHGYVMRREAILPVELVVGGGAGDFGLYAYPRLIPPRETPDAFLYD